MNQEHNMKKKLILVFVIFFLLSVSAFAQRNYKHQSGDILIGGDFFIGATPNLVNLISTNIKTPGTFVEGNYALTAALGLHVDFYLTRFISLSSGVMAKPGLYAFLNKDYTFSEDTQLTDIARSPLSVTVPVMAHFNIPLVEWLYVGAGVQLNFPVLGIVDTFANRYIPPELGTIDTKGGFFIGVPLDLGFDFISANSGGMRLFFRVTPEFHKNYQDKNTIVVPIGLVWQFINVKIR